jgi:O-antigen/teichoic acid export membrane protein
MAALTGNSLNVLVGSLQAIVLIPLYLDAISPRLYGAWLASAEILVWMVAMDLGIPNLMIQRIAAAHAGGDQRTAGAWFASGLLVLGLVATVVACFGVLIAVPLPMWFGILGPEASLLRGCFLLGTLAAAVTLFANGFVGLSRAIQDTAFMSGMLVVSTLVGLGTSLALLLNGWGLWAIAFGLLARAAVTGLAGVLFAVGVCRTEFKESIRFNRDVVRQLVLASPATAIGGASYALMSQSEIVLVAALLRPELAVVYALTRKAADVGRSLVDMIGFATYGGFAHLMGSPNRAAALSTRARILSLHLSLAVAVAAAYLAVNRSFMDRWLSPGLFGGALLVFLMAVQCVVLGHSYLINLLYRATGRVVEGSIALVAEALVRLPLLAILLLVFGLPGLPVAAITTAAISALIVQRLALKHLGGRMRLPVESTRPVWIARLLVLAIGGAFALAVYAPNWLYVIPTGAGIALVGGFALVVIDPALRDGFISLLRRENRMTSWLRRV